MFPSLNTPTTEKMLSGHQRSASVSREGSQHSKSSRLSQRLRSRHSSVKPPAEEVKISNTKRILKVHQDRDLAAVTDYDANVPMGQSFNGFITNLDKTQEL